VNRLSLSWEGELIDSVHGDLVEWRDVEKLLEELEALRAASRPVSGGVVCKGRFGYVNGSDAQKFLAGDRSTVTVSRMSTVKRSMPLYFPDSPVKYVKPAVGDACYHGGARVTCKEWTRKGIIVVYPGGRCKNTDSWELKRDGDAR